MVEKIVSVVVVWVWVCYIRFMFYESLGACKCV